MKLLIKILFSIITLLLITVISIAFIFDPNDYKAEIITLFKDKTGRNLTITGDISLSLFPWIGIELGKIEVGNAKSFGKQAFAKMAHLQVRAKLWPLLKQKLEADTLKIDGLTLNLTKNQQGISNWNDLSQTETSTATMPKSVKKTSEKTNSAPLLAAFAINGIEISQSQLNWHDQRLNQKITVKDIQLNVGQLRPESHIPFAIQFHFQQKELDARIKFKSQIVFSSTFKQFSFYNTLLETDLKHAALKIKQTPKLTSSLISLDLDTQTASSKELSLSAGAVSLNTQFSAKNILSTIKLKSHINIKPFNPHDVTEMLDIKLAEMADNKALTQVSAELDLNGSLDKASLSNIKIKLDDTSLSGQAAINFTPFYSKASLNIDSINLDRYLPKASETNTDPRGKNDPKTDDSKAVEAALIPVALLTQLNLDANIKINKLQIKKTHWEKVHLVAKAKSGANQGNLQIKPFTMEGYGARITSSFNLNALNKTAQLNARLTINDMKSGLFLKDFMDLDKLQGLASIKADISSKGIRLSQLKQNLNGSINLGLRDGIIKGFDLNHQKQSLDAKLKGQPAPPAPTPVQTEFASLSASAVIKNGLLSNKDLRAATPFTRIIGHGNINIPQELLDYMTSVKFTSSTEVKNTETYENMTSIPLDILIWGTFSKPDIKVNFKKALEKLAKKELQKEVKKIEQKAKTDIKKKIEKKLGDSLKKLFRF